MLAREGRAADARRIKGRDDRQKPSCVRLSPSSRPRIYGSSAQCDGALRKRLPTAHEVVYEYRDCFVISYSPNERGYEGVLAIRASADGVKLYFNRGKGLPDPEKLLQGSGKPDALDSPGGRVHTRSSGGREPDRRGHRSQSRAVRAHRPRVGGHSFGIGQAASAASPRLTCRLQLDNAADYFIAITCATN